MRFVVREKLAGGTAPEFLEFFGELAGDAELAAWHDVDAGFERFREAIPGFKKNCRFGAFSGYVQLAFALSAFDWKKSTEVKSLS